MFGVAVALAEQHFAATRPLRITWLAIMSILSAAILVSTYSIVNSGLNRLEKSNAQAVAQVIVNTGGTTNHSVWMVPTWQSLTIDYYVQRLGFAPLKWIKYSSMDQLFETLSSSSDPHSYVVVASLDSSLEYQLQRDGYTQSPTSLSGIYAVFIK
jgi:uncharacterized SAM-binding protein YcdF (DUF218 family)